MNGHYYRAVPSKLVAQGRVVNLLGNDGKWRKLDGTALSIWQMFAYPSTPEQAIARLSGIYAVPSEAIAASVHSIVDELQQIGLIAPTSERPSPLRERYLDLLKAALLNKIYPEHGAYISHIEAEGAAADGKSRQRMFRDIAAIRPDLFDAYVADEADRKPTAWRFAHTMVGKARLDNIERCAEAVLRDGIGGDFLEAGVCQGGASIFMRGLQVAHGAADRQTWVVDSFQGVPPSTDPDDARFGVDLDESNVPGLAYSEERVREHFRRYDLLDGHVRFVPGWLKESLPNADIPALSILRLDVDLYSSTKQGLEVLYDKVSPGGFVIIDDYGVFECCAAAVDEFRAARGIMTPMVEVDRCAVFWRKD